MSRTFTSQLRSAVRGFRRSPWQTLRRAISGRRPPAGSSVDVPNEIYPQWFADRVASRASKFLVRASPGQFSLLTGVYERTPADVFGETAQSVLAQTSEHFEWIILAHGPISSALDSSLRALANDARVRVVRLATNLGVIGGMRRCLEEATGQYIIPLDADDLLTADALTIVASGLSQKPASYLYSDEDSLEDGRLKGPYFRPDWDPLLNLSCSYIFHLVAFDRRIAMEIGIYSDPASNLCHDWDTAFRFVAAGHAPAHIPEVLYHWRAHRASLTNKSDPHQGSLQSQRHVLGRFLSSRSDGDLFEIKPFPIFRGVPELWLSRKHVQPASFDLAVICRRDSSKPMDAQRGGYPLTKRIEANDIRSLATALAGCDSSFVAVMRDGVVPDGDEWAWEAQGLFALHSELDLLAGRIINPHGVVLGGPERIDAQGNCACPYRGQLWHFPGAMSLALKPQTVGCANSAFFVARAGFLKEALSRLPEPATCSFLGPWLALIAQSRGRRVGYSPLISGDARAGFDCVMEPSAEERRAYIAFKNDLKSQPLAASAAI